MGRKLSEKPADCIRQLLAIRSAFFDPKSKIDPFLGAKYQISQNRQFFNFALAYFKKNES